MEQPEFNANVMLLLAGLSNTFCRLAATGNKVNLLSTNVINESDMSIRLNNYMDALYLC